MRPIPIPPHLVPEGARRAVVTPPGFDLMNPSHPSPFEVLVVPLPRSSPAPTGSMISVLLRPEPAEVQLLTDGGVVMLSFLNPFGPADAPIAIATPFVASAVPGPDRIEP